MISAALYSDGFVGRHEELAFLQDECTEAREGRTRFVLIEGDAGIGKSRLVQEFLDAAAPPTLCAGGACSEQIRAPYLPFTEILQRLDPRGRLAPLRTSGRATYGEERALYFQSVAEVLERESARKPVIVTVEDVQWGDSATLELLRFLLTRMESARVLFLLTLRTEGVARNPALAALRSTASRKRCNTLQLRALRRNEIKHLVQGTLRRHRLHLEPATISQIEVLAEGNPLFAEELARIAVESGELTFHTHVPLSLQAILSERLSTFSDREREVLVRAAIIGETFEAPLLAAIAQWAVPEVLALMQRAVDRGLLVELPAPVPRFRFYHALLRQALADQLVLALAAPLHVRIASELESRPDAGDRAAELAYHWSAARVVEKAREWNERAAQAAWDVYAYRDAIRFYSAALRWDYPAGRRRAEIFERLGTLLYIDGCGDEPARWFRRCREEHSDLGNATGAARALLLLADQSWVDARTGESLRAASEAASTLDRLGERQLYAQAILSIARFSVTLGNALQSQAHLRALSRLHADFDPEMRIFLHEVRGEALALRGETDAALDDFREASRLASRSGTSELIAQVENNFALAAVDLGELQLACKRHRIAVQEAERTGMTWRVAYSSLAFAYTLTLLGRLAEARSVVWDALESGVTTATFKTKAATVGIPLALMLNDRALLEACADEDALRFAQQSGEMQRIGSVNAAFAQLREAQGSPHEARELLSRALAATPHVHRCWDLFVAIARWGSTQDVALARTELSAAQGRPRVQRAYALLFAALTARRGDGAHAKRLAVLAATAFRSMGDRVHEAAALEAAGRTAEAVALYDAMGSVRDIERLRMRSAKNTGELTARQREIAALVAQGATNREIAGRLHISEYTVEHHLSGIFVRLGIKSRAQLAHAVAQREASAQ